MKEVQKDKKQKKIKPCNDLTEKDSSKNSDPVSLQSTEDKEKLLLCVADFSNSILLIHRLQANTQPITEDISTQESNILGVFCNINDVEVSLYLLPYVMFWGGGSLSLMKDRFEHRTPETTISYGTCIYYSCS